MVGCPGGQKQRIAIARALVMNPLILILDEATSALDSASERIVQQAINELAASKQRTTVIIAHRLSTVRQADCIVVMNQGEIVEMGSHQQLMEQENSSYARLVQAEQDKAHEAEHEGHEPATTSANQNTMKKSIGEVVDMTETDSTDVMKASGITLVEQGEEEEALPVIDKTRLWNLSRPDLPFLVVGAVAAVLVGLAFPAFSLIIAEMFTALSDPATVIDESRTWSIAFAGLGLYQLIGFVTLMSSIGIAGENMTLRLRVRLFQSFLRQDIAWFDRSQNTTGSLCTRLAVDAENVRGVTIDQMPTYIQVLSMLIAGLTIAFINSWQLAFVLLGIGPLIGVAGAAHVRD